MIDEKKLIEEIRKRRDYWESKAAGYDEAGIVVFQSVSFSSTVLKM